MSKYNSENYKRLLMFIGGWSLIILGIISLMIPVIPGFLLMFLGITYCAKSSIRFNGFVKSVKRLIF